MCVGDVFCPPEEGTGGGLGMDTGHFKQQRFSPSPTPPVMALGTPGTHYSHSNGNEDSISTTMCRAQCQVPAKCANMSSRGTCRSRPRWPWERGN